MIKYSFTIKSEDYHEVLKPLKWEGKILITHSESDNLYRMYIITDEMYFDKAGLKKDELNIEYYEAILKWMWGKKYSEKAIIEIVNRVGKGRKVRV